MSENHRGDFFDSHCINETYLAIFMRMRYINLHFTYLLTYLLTYIIMQVKKGTYCQNDHSRVGNSYVGNVDKCRYNERSVYEWLQLRSI